MRSILDLERWRSYEGRCPLYAFQERAAISKSSSRVANLSLALDAPSNPIRQARFRKCFLSPVQSRTLPLIPTSYSLLGRERTCCSRPLPFRLQYLGGRRLQWEVVMCLASEHLLKMLLVIQHESKIFLVQHLSTQYS